MENQIGTYKVGIEADDLEGWTQESLALALVAPLAELGFAVEVVRNSTVLESVEITADVDGLFEEDQIREEVKRVVGDVIEGEPLDAVAMLLDPPTGPAPAIVEPKPFNEWPVEERLHARDRRDAKANDAARIENEILRLLDDLSRAEYAVALFDAKECPEIGRPTDVARAKIAAFMSRQTAKYSGDA
ncbi:MAG TPA: hypothetical protein HA263_08115 [Methanoregulaceae archaeon]|nr:hypothetical protein [Methanoregulaceae archaeon]